MYFEIKIIYEPSLYPHTTSLLLGHIRSTGCATGSYPITSVPHLTVKVWEDCLPPTFRDHSAIDNISLYPKKYELFSYCLILLVVFASVISAFPPFHGKSPCLIFPKVSNSHRLIVLFGFFQPFGLASIVETTRSLPYNAMYGVPYLLLTTF